MSKRLSFHDVLIRLPVIGLTLYLSRVLAEAGSLIEWPVGAISGGVIGLGGGVMLARFCLNKRPPGSLWPYLPLWAYVLYPFYDLRMGLAAGAISLLCWLIARFPQPGEHLLDGLAFCSALLLYTLTLSPGLLPADAGEFQLVAARLGVAHPPGYPLYTMLGKLFTLIPAVGPLRGLNFFSALTMALAAALTGRAARRLSGNPWSGLASAALLIVADSVWSTATQASIRPLTAFFAALCLERLIACRDTQSPKALAAFALSLSLGLTHHPSLVFPGVFFGIYLLLIDPLLIRQPRRWTLPLGAFAAGFLPWLYLPLRGAMGAPLAPDGLTTWTGFWNHVLARGFSGDFFYYHTLTDLTDRSSTWINILTLQWHEGVLLLAVLAGVIVLRRDWKAFVLLFGSFAFHSLITMSYRAPQTVEYLIPAYVSLAVLVGGGLSVPANKGQTGLGLNLIFLRRPHPPTPSPLHGEGEKFADSSGSGKRQIKNFEVNFSILLRAAILTLTLALGVQNWPGFAALARDDSTRQYAESLLENAPPDATILANWHWAAPLWALQEIEGLRPDVQVLYVYPEGAELPPDTWLRRIDLLAEEEPPIITNFYPETFRHSAYFFEPLGEGWLVSRQPRSDLPAGWQTVETPFSEGITLAGYHLKAPLAVGETAIVEVAWRIDQPLSVEWTASVHLTNPQISISNADISLPVSRAAAGDILISQHQIGMPPYGLPSPADDYTLTAALYTVDGGGQIIHQTTGEGAIFATLGAITVEPVRWPAPTAHPLHRVFADGSVLRGYDWEGANLYLHYLTPDGQPSTTLQTAADFSSHPASLGPWGIPCPAPQIPAARPGERYIPLGGQMVLSGVKVRPTGTLKPGEEVIVDLTLIGSRPLTVDNVVKVDLIGDNYAWRSQSDQIPATGAIPTLKWLPGWTITDRHRLTVPEEGFSGVAIAEMLVYDHFTGQPLSLLDLLLAREGIVVPLYHWPSE